MQSSSPMPAPALRSFRLRAPTAGPHPVLVGLLLALPLVGVGGALFLSVLAGARDQAPDSSVEVARSDEVQLVTTPARVPLDPLAVADSGGGFGEGAVSSPDSTPVPPQVVLTAPPADTPAADATPEASVPQAAEAPPPPLAEPAPPPVVQAPPGRPRFVVAGGSGGVNLRALPNTTSRVVATLPNGTLVEDLGTDARTASQGWRWVIWVQWDGYISSSLLRPAP